MKSYADKNRSPRQFQLGDSVFLKLQPYAQSSVANRPFPKLAFKYFGPSKVLAKTGNAAYKQVLPTHTQIHLVFHVSPLKHSVPDNTPVFSEIPAFPTLDRADVVPQLILHRRLVKKGDTSITQVQIQWSGLPSEMSTWEDYYIVKARFSSAPAWALGGSAGGGSVMRE